MNATAEKINLNTLPAYKEGADAAQHDWDQNTHMECLYTAGTQDSLAWELGYSDTLSSLETHNEHRLAQAEHDRKSSAPRDTETHVARFYRTMCFGPDGDDCDNVWIDRLNGTVVMRYDAADPANTNPYYGASSDGDCLARKGLDINEMIERDKAGDLDTLREKLTYRHPAQNHHYDDYDDYDDDYLYPEEIAEEERREAKYARQAKAWARGWAFGRGSFTKMVDRNGGPHVWEPRGWYINPERSQWSDGKIHHEPMWKYRRKMGRAMREERNLMALIRRRRATRS